MSGYIFAPGCALFLYKPHLIKKLHEFLNREYGKMDILATCCRHTPDLPPGKTVVNICPGCDRRYRENYEDSPTISLWELLADNDRFVFPDYNLREMTIIDACPTRNRERIHSAVRRLAEKMNIKIIEPARTRTNSTCCGDTFYGELPTDKVVGQMKKKAGQMPRDDILVYCISCSQSMFVGGKQPRYLIDLLFHRETVPLTFDPDAWHNRLDRFIEDHTGYETLEKI